MSARSRRLTSVADAAESYGVSERTIRRYIANGTLTAYRFGPRMIRVDLDELDSTLVPMGGGA
ncbi:hypothetical protein GCM10010528_00680 [Gordonia defluvii]|uniref:Helix-turn-helix domain-containing protein n=1 Tax=Gordonia defluvii TaxID=283718 RepID=A0ABP6KVD9_9ACTN